MANHMKEVANMLGVELGERFQVFNSVGSPYLCKFYFTEKDIVIDGTNNCAGADMLRLLIWGVYTIKRIPWKPTYHETYYSVGPGGTLEPGCWMNDFLDCMLYKLGNCYRTAADAAYNIDKWIEFYSSDEILEV